MKILIAITVLALILVPSQSYAAPTEKRVAVVTFVDTTTRLPMQWTVTNDKGVVVASGARFASTDPKIFSFGVPTGNYRFNVIGRRGDYCSMNQQVKTLLSGDLYTYRNRCTFW